ncbi:MAG TPA: DNA polymerase IV [Candidatus Limisoma intestinavium]|uniref:DNA polymerase IV n=1 Tax=Candidatus Limisoma intestinavium TaxID=2840856 RepID=A0A9D1IIW6_9BACT|nr:DNA polymerase IV [Candidatus Limisoma intestinavium]
MPEYRKIIHVDMDAFYASVEQRDHPELRGKPVAVGHEEMRSVVAAASYEARRYGVRSAMPSVRAKRLCPDLIFVEGRMQVYKEVSAQIHEIFRDYTDLIEPLSLDEAFLDVTHNKKGIPLAVDIAIEIKRRIREELHLTASAGVSYNKFLAKVASDYRKPDGLCTVHPSQALDFIAHLPIEAFWGVGQVTARKMHAMGIHNGALLRSYSKGGLIDAFGKVGALYYDFARGIDNRQVEPERVRKSIGCERTLEQDLSRRSLLTVNLYQLVLELTERLKRHEFEGNTLTLKVKYADFTQVTHSRTVNVALNRKSRILPLAKELLAEVDCERLPVRLLGLSVSNPAGDAPRRSVAVQLSLDF